MDQLKEVDLGGIYQLSDGLHTRLGLLRHSNSTKSNQKCYSDHELSTLTKDRLYLGGNEIYREKVSGSLSLERETLHISDDTRRIGLIDAKPYDGGTIGSPTHEIRYQIGNHLQSASLELDDTAAIITYEEYHPFGTSSYRLGRTSSECHKNATAMWAKNAMTRAECTTMVRVVT